MATEKADRSKEPFDDPTKLTRSTQLSLYALGAVTLASIGAELFQRAVLMRASAGDTAVVEAAELSDVLVGSAGLAYLAALIVSGVLSLIFIYRANLNAQRLGAELENSARWAVGSYFVPFLNLWAPYQAMKEIWEASENPQYPQRVVRPGLLPAWWTLWLFNGALGQAAFRVTMNAEELEELLTANAVNIASDVVGLPLIVVFYLLVTRIYHMQMEHDAARVFA